MYNNFRLLIFSLILGIFCGCQKSSNYIVPINIESNYEGSPIFFGIPIPKGTLFSVDKVRVLNQSKVEIPSQITEVSSWFPKDNSIKWIWVFFFSEESNDYFVEYGDKVTRKEYNGPKLSIENNMRNNGFAEIITGPLKFRVNKNGNGFIDEIFFNSKGNNFSQDDIIASGSNNRGSFLDIFDDNGIDYSKSKHNKNRIRERFGSFTYDIKS